MIEGVGRARRQLLQDGQARSAVTTASRSLDARPQPELQREDRQHASRGRASPTASSSSSTRTSTTSTTRSPAGELRRRVREPASPKVIPRVLDEREQAQAASRSNSADQTNYVTMNVTQPPFDDLAVRRAMNWVMDRDRASRKRLGRRRCPVAVAGSAILPDAMHGQRAEELLPVQDVRVTTGSVPEGEGRDGEVEVRELERCLQRRQGVQERPVDRRRPCGRQGDAARRSSRARRRSESPSRSRCGERRLPGHPDDRRTTLPISDASALVQGLRGPGRRSSIRCSSARASSRPATRTTRSSASRPSQVKALEGHREHDRACPRIDAMASIRCAKKTGNARYDVLRRGRSRSAHDEDRPVDPVSSGRDQLNDARLERRERGTFDQDAGLAAFGARIR